MLITSTFFFSIHAAIFCSLVWWQDRSSGSIFPLRFILSLTPSVNLCPVFYLKAYLRHTESFRKKSDGSRVTFLFWVTIGSISLSVLKPFLPWVWKVLSVAKAHTSPDSLGVVARHYFSTYITTMDQHQDSMQHAVLGLSE